MRKRVSRFSLVISILLLIVILAAPAFAQRSSYRSRSYGVDASSLPELRAPVTESKLTLSEIPYRIVYESYLETDGSGNWEICLIDADGSNYVNLTNSPNVHELYPHSSPDGTKICFVAIEGDTRENRSRNIYLMNIDGSGLTKIAENAYQPCWSGEGEQIAYLKGEYSRFSDSSWANRGIEFYNLQTGRVTPHPNPELGMLFNLCWSPDGTWFTATSRARYRGGSNIAFRADNTSETTLSIRGCRPDISPDGGQIAWGISDHVLMIGNLDLSSSLDNVTDQKPVIACYDSYKVYHVDWSPDGKYLAFSYGPSSGDQAVGRRAPGWNICVCDLETGEWIQITSDGNHNKEPDWVPIKSAGSKTN